MRLARTLAAIATAAACGLAHADNFTLRMGGGHTTGLTYVDVFDKHFATEVAKRVRERTPHRVRFIKAWGGSVAKVDGAVEAVQKGTLDIGLSPIGFEQSRAGLLNYSAYMPFTSPDPVLQQKVSNRMIAEMPALQDSMKPYNSYVLAAMTTEAYGLTSTFEWKTIAELQGKRIGVAGTNAPLFMAVDAVPVNLGIGEHYQAAQNKLIDASYFFISGLEAFKLKEVAKYFTKTGMGSLSTLVAFMNLETRAKLPKEVVAIIDEVAAESAMQVAERSRQRDIDLEKSLQAEGVTVYTLPVEERAKWAERLKDLPGRSAKELDAKGQPATEVLKTYVRFLAEAGYEFPVDYPL
ncbi:MAG: TRAP transporter substrate-binding protein DctP [Burkholderiaceae bacterium]|nr:TRAP transporter substrate-binding protein DctP [Burkholderiaceae bacterium]